MAWEQTIQSTFVHVHYMNRDGFGCSPADVHMLLDDILAVGYDGSLPKPIACELSESETRLVYNLYIYIALLGSFLHSLKSPKCHSSFWRILSMKTSKEANRVWKFNDDLQKASMHTPTPLSPVERTTVKYGSLGASHLNQAIRCFKASVKHESAGPVVVNGFLSPETLKLHDPEFYGAVQNGLSWVIIAGQVMTQYPSLAQLIQESANTGGQLQRKEGELQLARRIHNLTKHSGSHLTYTDMKETVLRSRPACASSGPFLFVFTMKYGGGEDASLLQETESYVRNQTSSQRMLGPAMWDALSSDYKQHQSIVRVRHALIRLCYISDEKFIGQACIRKLFSASMMGALKLAEELFCEIRDLVKTQGLANEFMDLISQWEHEAIKVLMDKKGSHKSIEEALQVKLQEIEGSGGPCLSTEWSGFAPSAPHEASSESTPANSTVILDS